MKQRITLKEVAAQAGVSYQTVSKVLNHKVQVSPETESKIWEAARTLGYRPNQLARNLRSQRSCLIGYSWFPVPPEHHNPIIDQFVQSMLNAVEGTGYNLLCFRQPPGSTPVDAYRELVDSHRVDAFVLSDVEFHDPRVVFLKERRFPFVAFGRTDPELDVPFVDVDGALGIRQVVRHLVERGHRRIGVLTWPEGSRVGEDRMEGYFTGLHDAGITPQRDWIMRGDGVFNFGYESAVRWLDMPIANRPTAVIAFNDYMALGVKQAVEERSLQVGIDLAICGFDDTPLVKYLTPPLTSVKQPIWEIGQRIVSMIVDLLEEKPLLYRRMILQPELIIRQSSANHFGPGN